MSRSVDELASFGARLRADAPRFLEAATDAFAEAFAKEYYRLRGYAHESSERRATLRVDVICTFVGDGRGVVIHAHPLVDHPPTHVANPLKPEP